MSSKQTIRRNHHRVFGFYTNHSPIESETGERERENRLYIMIDFVGKRHTTLCEVEEKNTEVVTVRSK